MPEHSGMPGRGEAYFVVLPDHETALAVASGLPHTRTLRYASVIGTRPADTSRLYREAGRLTGLASLDRTARELPGSFHLVASLDGRSRVQGTRPGCGWCSTPASAGVTVAADRANVLAAPTGAELDDGSSRRD